MNSPASPQDPSWYGTGLRFTCTCCGKCCTGAPGFVWINEEEEHSIADFLGEDHAHFVAFHTRRFARGRSLREKANGDCVFWDADTGCTVYSVRPGQCRTWPFWESNVQTPTAWDQTCAVCPGAGVRAPGLRRRDHAAGQGGAPVSALQLRGKVLELYAEADRAVAAAGPLCIASGRCCRFKEHGHVLFLSSLEADVLLAGAPPYAAPVTAEFCPFQKDNLCTARAPRPLGCRVYFCDPSYQERSHAITEDYLARLKALAASEGVEWKYAPLHFFLNNPDEATAETASEPEA